MRINAFKSLNHQLVVQFQFGYTIPFIDCFIYKVHVTAGLEKLEMTQVSLKQLKAAVSPCPPFPQYSSCHLTC